VLHEEAGAAIAHGYAKAAGKPMMTLMHGTVGLLHADGPLPRVVRPRSRVRDRRSTSQSDERHQPTAQRAGHGLHRPRLHEDGRRAHEPRRVREHRDARVYDWPHAAEGSDVARRRLGASGSADSRSEQAHDSAPLDAEHPAGRLGRRARGGAASRDRRASAAARASSRALRPAGTGSSSPSSCRRPSTSAATARGKTSRRGTRCTARAAPTTAPTSSSGSRSTT
jgi:hypothetical protein